jgi:hypothetical protein
MPQIAFLNERSHLVGNLPEFEARNAFEKFIDLMLALRKVMPRLSLICCGPLLSQGLGDNYGVHKWLNETQRERKQFLLSLGQLAPFSEAERLFGERDPGVSEYVFDGQPFDGLVVVGIGFADLYGALAISFGHDRRWHLQSVPVRVLQLLDEGEKVWRTPVPHAVFAGDVAFHRVWLLESIRRDIRDATSLWDLRNDLLPNLRFHPAVEADLQNLQPSAFMQVVTWLFRANDQLDGWNPEATPIPQYPPHTTGEAEIRRRLFWIRDQGEPRCFHMHGRYTPGAGRIHFWLSAPERRIIIGYVGLKVENALQR